MSTIVTRAGKGSPLTNTEVDANFNNLNSTKLEVDGAITVKDNVFTLQDNLDPTKQAQFQLSGLTTATTFNYTLPLGSAGASTLMDLQSVQSITATKTFVALQTFTNPNGNFCTGANGGTVNVSSGATISGQTKIVNLGTGGASGSTTNITVGSANGSTTNLNGDVIFNSVAAATLPAGTTAQRPTGVTGMFRYNTTTPGFEGFNGTAWGAIGGGSNITTLGLYENANTISANYTIGAGNNAVSAGPITINSGVVVTVPSGSTWVVV
jgi:hypothetical protein